MLHLCPHGSCGLLVCRATDETRNAQHLGRKDGAAAGAEGKGHACHAATFLLHHTAPRLGTVKRAVESALLM
jgi:hypothetical protein